MHCRPGISGKTSAICLFVLLATLYGLTAAHAESVVWIQDGSGMPAYRLRGLASAKTDLQNGAFTFYLPVCTFAAPDKKELRRYEIRKALYDAAGIVVMADLCKDLLPNALQQERFVEECNAVMDAAIARRLGKE